MLRFAASRLAQTLLALWFITVVVFLMTRASGDPIALLLGPQATADQIDQVRTAMGLDQPLAVQYGLYLRDLIGGDLGVSLRSRLDVVDLIAAALPASASLALSAMAMALMIGIPLGVISATNRGRWLDVIPKSLSILGQSAPSFLVGIVLIQLFAVNVRWFPASGFENVTGLILPSLTLAMFLIAGILRLVRTSMLEILDTEFIKLARAKGLPEHLVIWKHALRNALIPVISFAGMWLALLVTLNAVVEVVFSWPGLGTLLYNSILARDFPVTQGVSLVTAAIVLGINFVMDLVYAVADPRVRMGSNTA